MYQYKDKYTIDFSEVENYLEMHSIIAKSLDFPDYYGCNWDAFWDCLTNMLGRPIYIEIIGLDVIEKRFDDSARTFISILKEFKHCDDDEYVDDIKIEIVSGDNRVAVS